MITRNRKSLILIRHSTAHIMAEAVLEKFPEAKIAIGPSIENGFYYDFEFTDDRLTPEDLEDISATVMRDIMKAGKDFIRKEVSKRTEALEMFKEQPYKIELINELPEDEVITTYNQGGFTDLCRGPHVENTGKLNPQSFKLLLQYRRSLLARRRKPPDASADLRDRLDQSERPAHASSAP